MQEIAPSVRNTPFHIPLKGTLAQGKKKCFMKSQHYEPYRGLVLLLFFPLVNAPFLDVLAYLSAGNKFADVMQNIVA